ncbi:MAG: hypothetical protein ACRCSN_12915 [Dermatophilaceae bacterium]
MTHAVAARYSTLIEGMKDRREAGQNSLEYMGMALVAGVVILAITDVVSSGTVREQIQKAWENIVKAN